MCEVFGSIRFWTIKLVIFVCKTKVYYSFNLATFSDLPKKLIIHFQNQYTIHLNSIPEPSIRIVYYDLIQPS